MHRVLAVFAAGSLLALCTSPAFSLGFGKSANGAGLGQPLAFSATIMLGEGEVLSEKCVAAEVLAGESRVEASQVRVRVEPATAARAATLHVTTGVAIVEPVVTVNIKLGCPARVSRSFVALLDPPLVREAAEASAAARSTQTEQPPQALAVPAASAPASRSARATPPARAAAPAKRPAPRRTAAAASARPSADDGEPRAALRPKRRASQPPAAASEVPQEPPARPTSRLSLDPLETAGTPAGAAAVPASAAAAAPPASTAAGNEVAAAAARAAEQRIRHLDDELTRMRRESAEMRDSLAALNARLRMAEAARDDRWVWALGLLCAVLALAVIWLLRRQARMQPPAWWNDSRTEPPATPGRDSSLEHGEPTSAAALQVHQPSITAAVVADAPSVAAAAVNAEATRAPAAEPVRVPPPSAHEPPSIVSRTERRALAVEELIDLEQQADFFLVLGQDEAAIDLLMTHVRSSGGESPMPYLKLLEIYRRRGDAPAYSRIRERFNYRFNAYAPEWADDARPSTRTLEDYPRVIERLQQVWSEPWQALDLLDTLLFRPDSTDISFDLPAYADLLFLYSVAGHLVEEGGPVTHVDLLLPLDGDMPPSEISAIEHTTPHLPRPPERSSGWLPAELSLDLDLDHPATGPVDASKPG